MPLEGFTNYPATTVTAGGTAAPASGSSESWTVLSSAPFPPASNSGTPPTWFHVADANLPGEVMTVTNVSGSTWTVTRGAEGTATAAHSANWTVKQVFSAGGAGMWPQYYNVRSLVYGAKGDGTTDDTAAINAALTAAAGGGGGVVYLPAGTYKVSSTVAIPAGTGGVTVCGAGRGATVIKAAAGFTAATPVIQAQASGSDYRYDIAITDLTVQTAQSGLYGIQLDSTYFAVVERVDVQGVWTRNIFLNGSGSFFGAYTSIRDCNLGPVPGGSGSSGTGIYSNDHEHWVVEDCTINWFDVTGGIGVQINSSDCRVTGCRMDECDTAIVLNFCAQAIISENFFDRGLTTFVQMKGCTGAQIINNSFNVFSGAGSQYIIVPTSDGGRAGNRIAGNRVLNGAGWHGFVNEAGGSSTDPDVYVDNNLETVTTVNRTSSSIWRNNIGLNPAGKVSSPPSVPASTGTATNTTGTDCMVYVTTGGGVTISAILVGGQAAGAQSQAASSTSAGIRVPALQTIALTYAGGTPTWTWFGD